jgi:hypothetical protein
VIWFVLFCRNSRSRRIHYKVHENPQVRDTGGLIFGHDNRVAKEHVHSRDIPAEEVMGFNH